MRLTSRLRQWLRQITLGSLVFGLFACQSQQPFPMHQGLQPKFFSFSNPTLPANFIWGVSTAGYQVEGGDTGSQWHKWEEAGRTEHRSGKAVDFLNRYSEDIGLARQMGTNGFRISLEWSRIEPAPGQFDASAIAFYKNLVKEIRAQGQTPVVTLLHFTYPSWLDKDADGDKLTGWEDPDVIEAYLRYVDRIVRELGPDVQLWLTFNEPNIWIPIAHLFGQTPPGKISPFGFLRASRNVLQAHARAYDRIHGIDPDAQVSTNMWQLVFKPFGKKGHDLTMSRAEIEDFADSNWVMDAFETGSFPYADDQLFTTQQLPPAQRDVMGLFGRFDYVAFDYYYRFRSIKQLINVAKPWLMEIYPEGLYPVLADYYRRHRKPILIAENGISTYDDQPREDGWTRSANIVQHVNQVQKAVADGIPVMGYFHWAITDNYEWGTYHSRFGLYRVEALSDPTLRRIPTPAVDVYKAVIANGGVSMDLLTRHPAPSAHKALAAARRR